MPIDRESTLKKAEKLLRQGKLDGAIAEYVRLIEDQPKDWNSINALGDLYVRAGQTENAVAQFSRVADYLYAEGFMPKAAALYKKVLRIKPDDEQTLLRLAELSTGTGVLVDAKKYYRQVAQSRKQRGDQAGAAQIAIRLGEIDPGDAEAKVQAARAAQTLSDVPRAAAFLTEAADAFEKQKRVPDALAALSEAVALEPDDEARRNRLLTALLAQRQMGEARQVARTAAELLAVAAALEESGSGGEALDVMAEAAELDPQDVALRARVAKGYLSAGNVDRARRFLTAETAGDDPELLMIVARLELEAGRVEEGKTALHRLLGVRPDRRDELVLVACELADKGHVDAAFACVDLVADAALLEEDWGGAAAALNEFVTRVTNHVAALMKLVEICVDGGLESTMYAAQAQLADAYLAAGLGAEARVIAEDLVAREPWVRANIDRFRRALIMLGTPDPDALIAERLSGDGPFLSTIDLPGQNGQAAAAATQAPEVRAPGESTGFAGGAAAPMEPVDLPAIAEPEAADAGDPEGVVLEPIEVDLTDALSGLDGGLPPAAGSGGGAPDAARARARRETQLQTAQARYAAGLEHAEQGRQAEAMACFEEAARVPRLRFAAGSRLGRMHLAQGDLDRGIEWLDRASQAPPPTPEEGYAVLYDLAEALEQAGEGARALAVLIELAAEADDFRDVAERIDRLSKVQAGS